MPTPEPTPLALWEFWAMLMKDRPELIPPEFTLRWHKRLAEFNRLCGHYDPFRIIEETVKDWHLFIGLDGVWPRPAAPNLEMIMKRYDFAIALQRGQASKEFNASLLRPALQRLIFEHSLLDLKPSEAAPAPPRPFKTKIG